MKRTSLASIIALTLAIAGCSSGDGDVVKPQAALNPSGKPRNQAESDLTSKYQDAGSKANAGMDEMARHMKAASGK